MIIIFNYTMNINILIRLINCLRCTLFIWLVAQPKLLGWLTKQAKLVLQVVACYILDIEWRAPELLCSLPNNYYFLVLKSWTGSNWSCYKKRIKFVDHLTIYIFFKKLFKLSLYFSCVISFYKKLTKLLWTLF